MLKTWLTKKHFEVETAISIANAKKEIENQVPDLVISDIRLPDGSGISFLKWTKAIYPNITFIMMTSYADIQSAVEAIRSGAYDYISKPVNPEELLKKIKATQTTNSSIISTEILPIEKTKKNVPDEDYVKGTSEKYQKVYKYINLVAPTNLSVFIKGESGVGKEHLARMIHEKSKRAEEPFIPVDCGVMNKELSASEFFGHIKGSFTGAINNKKGYFVEADRGTLFLDEIGNLSLDIQMQLLRVLQEKRVKPVGATREIEIDIRVVVATNEDLEQLVKEGRFRRDLYHRLNEFAISVPSLSECKEDIPLYINFFLTKANEDLERNIKSLNKDVYDYLINYPWKGNIRELKNVIYRVVLTSEEENISLITFMDNLPHMKEYYGKEVEKQ